MFTAPLLFGQFRHALLQPRASGAIVPAESTEENWDAFEGVSGKPLLRLFPDRQPWRQVRFWLYDLSREISAAEKDGTLPPVLTLDRVWIIGDGRAKLLDFPAPGLAVASPRQAGAAPAAPPSPEMGRSQSFLGEVAVAALEGRADAAAKTAGEAAVPLPLHARVFLENLPHLSDADAVAGAIQPLLRRPAAVSRLRRAAVVAGCAAFPVLASCFMILGMTMLQPSYPGIMELSLLLQQRQAKSWMIEEEGATDGPGHKRDLVTNRQLAGNLGFGQHCHGGRLLRQKLRLGGLHLPGREHPEADGGPLVLVN